MCVNTGGPCKTINRPLAEVHVGLGVTDAEFDIVGGLRDYVVEARIKK